jgi:hypothetical protein
MIFLVIAMKNGNKDFSGEEDKMHGMDSIKDHNGTQKGHRKYTEDGHTSVGTNIVSQNFLVDC